MSAKINIQRKSIRWVLMGLELQFDKLFTVETQYPCSSLLVASSALYSGIEKQGHSSDSLNGLKARPSHVITSAGQTRSKNDLIRMHQPIREYRGITGGFILVANTITI